MRDGTPDPMASRRVHMARAGKLGWRGDCEVSVDDCVFCAIAAGAAPAFHVYEDDRTIAFLDINPWGRGHTLVAPKTHAENIFDVDPDDLHAVIETVHRLAPRLRDAVGAAGMAIAQLNGADAGQTVFHLHLHLLPRQRGDGLPTGPLSASHEELADVHRTLRAALAV
jgi:histidine triad (HIT) family protein